MTDTNPSMRQATLWQRGTAVGQRTAVIEVGSEANPSTMTSLHGIDENGGPRTYVESIIIAMQSNAEARPYLQAYVHDHTTMQIAILI